ncbi:hypothetical protein [Desulfovibrio ferrophilus]|uniref:Outer membrane protein beta-barrel domain-containing protein n=1 Tax=Desulfovibrio ferrophilus TaxID=241368 RepID=A0A2Z6AY22_9BACT|nr:hypothetical protein [Desulfovibrio ferrophilus]BBD08151.1 uncharacterized protein DFE_1425 [Desulfovibrio ferrophilus]
MKTKIAARLVLVLICLMNLAFPCQAKELFPPSEFKLAYETMYMFYDEPNVMHEEGFLNGLSGSWTGDFTDNHLMASVELGAVGGSMDYVGHYSNGTSLRCSTNDTLLTARAIVGKGFDFRGTGVTPFVGLSARHWYDKIKVQGGYERFITQLHLTAGVNVISRPWENWSLGGSLEGNLLLMGGVESKLSQAGPGYEDAFNRQRFGNGGGARLSIFAEYDFGDYSLGAEPYFRYWHFADSKKDRISFGGVKGRVMEPENDFYISGLKLYIKF